MSTSSSSAGLASAYGRLLDMLDGSADLDTFLHLVVRLTADAVSPATACGMTVRRDGRPEPAASSGALAARVDGLQYGAGEGPGLDSLRTGIVVQVDDLPADGRWPRYRPHAVAFGVLSSLSLPLARGGETIAALNLYSVHRAAFTGPARQTAEAFAAHCAAALAVSLRRADDARSQRQLGEAMASRSVIDQAIGIVMGQQRCTASVAFDLLRQASQHRNVKLRQVASDIITNVTGQPPQPPPTFKTRGDRPPR